MQSQLPQFSVIIPVFNSATTLVDLVVRTRRVMERHGSYELLLIDDFSSDNSWEVLVELKQRFPEIRCLRLTRNFGQAAVNLCGIRESKANTLISIDDDLQFPPEEISKLIAQFDPKNKYILFGVPEKKQGHPLLGLASKVVDKTIRWLAFNKSDKEIQFSTFRIFTRKAYNHKHYNEGGLRSMPVFFTMVSPSLMGHVLVRHEPRKSGKSNYSIFKKIQLYLDLILTITTLPTNLFISISALFFSLLTASILLVINGNANILSQWIIPILLMGVFIMSIGFIFIFIYLKSMYLIFQGADVYAVWEEAQIKS